MAEPTTLAIYTNRSNQQSSVYLNTVHHGGGSHQRPAVLAGLAGNQEVGQAAGPWSKSGQRRASPKAGAAGKAGFLSIYNRVIDHRILQQMPKSGESEMDPKKRNAWKNYENMEDAFVGSQENEAGQAGAGTVGSGSLAAGRARQPPFQLTITRR